MCGVLLKVDAIQRGQTLLSSVQWTAALSSESAFPSQATLLEGGGGQADGTIGLLLSLCVRTVACSQTHPLFSDHISATSSNKTPSLTLRQKRFFFCEKVGLAVLLARLQTRVRASSDIVAFSRGDLCTTNEAHGFTLDLPGSPRLVESMASVINFSFLGVSGRLNVSQVKLLKVSF